MSKYADYKTDLKYIIHTIWNDKNLNTGILERFNTNQEKSLGFLNNYYFRKMVPAHGLEPRTL